MANSDETPGKTRTWWHPVFVNTLGHVLGDAYDVTGEFSVGKMPLRLDVVVVHRLRKRRPAFNDLPQLVELFSQYTLIEFKSPKDKLERGDIPHFFGASLLWFSQQKTQTKADGVTSVIVAPRFNGPAKKDLERLGCSSREVSAGVYYIQGFSFSAWVVESDILGKDDPVIAFFSRLFVRNPRQAIARVARPYRRLFPYICQLVFDFKNYSEEELMQIRDAEYVDQIDAELRAELLKTYSTEELKSVVTQRLTADERAHLISDNDIDSLSESERKRLLKLLNR